MNKQELKAKIIEIIEKNGTYNGRSLSFDYYVIQPDDLTNAFIKNDIGDISEYKHRAEVAENELARHKLALRIAGDKFINEVCNMRGEDISDKCNYKCDTCFYDYYLQQAEKELQEGR